MLIIMMQILLNVLVVVHKLRSILLAQAGVPFIFTIEGYFSSETFTVAINEVLLVPGEQLLGTICDFKR